MKAARRIVAHILRIIELVCANNFQGNRLLMRKGNRILKLKTGEAGRICDNGEHVSAQSLMGGPRQESGIRTARVGDESAPERSQRMIESGPLRFETGGHRHVNILCRNRRPGCILEWRGSPSASRGGPEGRPYTRTGALRGEDFRMRQRWPAQR